MKPVCNKEISEYKRQYYLENRDKILNQRRLYSEVNRDLISQRKKMAYRFDLRKSLLTAAKRRSKVNNVIFDLIIDDIIIPKYCPILGLELLVGSGKIQDNSPSLDRIDTQAGYTKENIQVISNLANRMKNSATFEQLVLFSQWIDNTIKPIYKETK